MASNRWANPINNNILKDAENNVLAGGSLEFYLAGTSTAQEVFSDAAQTVSAGSILTADAYGKIEDFHLAAGISYKIICKDSGGVTKWTVDNINGIDFTIETRIDALESTVNNINTGNNDVVNSSCQAFNVNSNDLIVDNVTLTSSFLEGVCTGIYGRATNVSAGVMTRVLSTSYTSGAYFKLQGVTTTNSASVAEGRFVVRAGDCGKFVDQQATVSVIVYHDIGVAADYDITVYKADSYNDFSSVTQIDTTSSSTSVTSGTDTTLTFTVANMGDCSNGIAIDISCACGVQTTKEYRFTMCQLVLGGTATSWVGRPNDADKAGFKYKPRQLPPGAIKDCQLTSDAGDTAHDINIAAGSARDSTDAVDIILSTEITKQIDAVWASGDDAGGFPSGVNGGVVEANKWYYFFLIAKADGTTDAGFDSSATATNLLADATGYVYYAPIGGVSTDSSANVEFIQYKPEVGIKKQVKVFTSSGTFMNPPYGTLIAHAIGGGGGGASGNTNGTAGGNSSYGSHCQGNGGGAGQAAGGNSTGGSASLGDINMTGNPGDDGLSATTSDPLGGYPIHMGYGRGGNGQASNTDGAGASGGASIAWVNDPMVSVTVTVGAGGVDGASGSTRAGSDGAVILEF